MPFKNFEVSSEIESSEARWVDENSLLNEILKIPSKNNIFIITVLEIKPQNIYDIFSGIKQNIENCGIIVVKS